VIKISFSLYRTDKILIFISFLLLSFQFSIAQNSNENIKELIKTADGFFDNSQYRQALIQYLKIDSLKPEDSEINYKIGACYLNSRYEKIKALPYLEFAINDKRLQFPKVVYKDLGMLYHLDYQFNNAIKSFRKYLELAGKKDKYILYARRMIEVCRNAIEITNNSYDLEIENVGYPVSTKNNEFSPLISADETIMFFMRIEESAENWKIGRFETQGSAKIMYSTNTIGQWEDPHILKIDLPEKETYVALAGLSPDGETVYLQIGEGKKADIYEGVFANGSIVNLVKLPNSVNSKHWEGRISISPDGLTLYFSSDRPGGLGGKDLYKVEKSDRGTWGKAQNLGSKINSKYDDDAPFMHPNNNSLYYSSKGHKTIGGFDIFIANKNGNVWDTPKNIGYPNSTKDDIYFVVSADGETGYFSTFQNNLLDNHHIYRVNLKKSIPLTLVKGTILAGEDSHPVKAKIKVIDKTTNETIKYIYNPNPNSGKYLMIFPPRKNYDMIIEAENFLPQIVNIYVPNQTSFYELFQEIRLFPVTSLGKVIGEQISVNNTFYNIYETSFADSILNEHEEDSTKDYGQLLQIVEDLINTTDSMGIDLLDDQYSIERQSNDSLSLKSNYDRLFNLIGQAIETTDSVSLAILDENTLYNEESMQTYFYDVNDSKNDLNKYVVDGDTIYTAPPISTSSNDKKSNFVMSRDKLVHKHNVDKQAKINEKEEILKIKHSTKENRKVIVEITVYFDQNKAHIKSEFESELNQIASLIVDNLFLGVEIEGFTDSQGEDDYNLGLSRKRSNNVLQYLMSEGMNSQKAIIKAFGEVKSTEESSEEQRQQNRRVDVKVFELINKD
jgi:outer membrane protein OmpA-like peptidoglycan-associated protein